MVAVKRAQEVRYSIGQVLEKLSPEFSDLTPSKLRFLEDQGLIEPYRTGSGYRKFSQEHIERLRLILTLQRDHYFPLKKISELLAEIDAGKNPVIPGLPQHAVSSIFAPRQTLTLKELAETSGVKSELIMQAMSVGLLPRGEVFGAEVIPQVKALGQLALRGVTPLHLKTLRSAAEKEAEVIKHAAALRSGKKHGPAFDEEATVFAELFETVRSALVRQNLR